MFIELYRCQISNTHLVDKKHVDLHLLDHYFFWTLGRINNHIMGKSINFEKGPAIILKQVLRYNDV